MVQVVSIIYFTEISFGLKIRFHCFPAKNCAAIGCLVELCPNGQMPPVPPGDHEIITRPLIMDHYIITRPICHHHVILKLNVKNTRLDDWCLILDTWYLILKTQCLILDAWRLPGRCCPSALLCPREDCPSTCPQVPSNNVIWAAINSVRYCYESNRSNLSKTFSYLLKPRQSALTAELPPPPQERYTGPPSNH